MVMFIALIFQVSKTDIEVKLLQTYVEPYLANTVDGLGFNPTATTLFRASLYLCWVREMAPIPYLFPFHCHRPGCLLQKE